jgi:hypothetical protein
MGSRWHSLVAFRRSLTRLTRLDGSKKAYKPHSFPTLSRLDVSHLVVYTVVRVMHNYFSLSLTN